MGWDNNYAAP